MDFWQIIAKYWIEWLCGAVALGLGLWAKFSIRALRKKILDEFDQRCEATKKMLEKEIETGLQAKAETQTIRDLEFQVEKVREESQASDRRIENNLMKLAENQDNVVSGLLSIQGKQFREMCLSLLDPVHVITVEEYEHFEIEYDVYKRLGGNHRGEFLHDRVVDKYTNTL